MPSAGESERRNGRRHADLPALEERLSRRIFQRFEGKLMQWAVGNEDQVALGRKLIDEGFDQEHPKLFGCRGRAVLVDPVGHLASQQVSLPSELFFRYIDSPDCDPGISWGNQESPGLLRSDIVKENGTRFGS